MSAAVEARDVELLLTDASTAGAIANLYPLYLHDVASYEPKPPNRHGVLSDDDGVGTWDELFAGQSAWFTQPGVLFPYLIRANGTPAGFLWVASGPYVPTPGSNFVLHELFVAHAHRGTGLAAHAVRATLERHAGTWEIATWPTATRALAFWRRTLPACAAGAVRETDEPDHPWGRRVVFRLRTAPCA